MLRTIQRTAAGLLPLLLTLLLAAPVLAQADGDGDGVDDGADLCPAVDASFFDGDGDGCIDATANARHTEFWAPGDLPLDFVIHANGAPVITDGSDFTAIQAGYAAWTTLPGVQLSVQYGGTTPLANASGTDGIHQVSFEDPDFVAVYGNAVLAVGLTTSFTVPTQFDGRLVLPGQIVDADMLFNPNRTFSTPTGGTGPDLQSVAVHEAGHLFGFAHSCVVSSTMFPALPGGAAARSLETEDLVLAFMGYPDAATLPGATSLSGTITNGDGGLPVPGAAVFAISVATGDTLGCQYTLPDGAYLFAGLPEGDYYVTVHPLDGGLGVGGVVPALINDLVDSTAVTLFVPEAWDQAESATDDDNARDPVTLSGGVPVTGIDIVTNVDAAGPAIVDASPSDGAAGVRADAVFVIEFSEPIDFGSAQQAFRFERVTANGRTALGGSLVLISEGTRLVFDPSGLLAYDGSFELTMAGTVADLFGNTLGADQVFAFSVESAPPLHIDSAAPAYIAPGALVVIGGVSFDTSDPALNVVDFGGTTQPAESVTPTALVVRAPAEVPVTAFQLTVSTPGGGTSNALDVFGVSGTESARGTPFGEVELGATPRAVAMLPDGRFAFAATSAGLVSVVTDPALLDFLTPTAIPLAGGAVDVAVTPDGTRAYAVNRTGGSLAIVNADYGDPANRNPLFNTVIDEIAVDAEPLGLAVTPDGRRVFVSTAEGVVQAWDVQPASATYNTVVGEIVLPATPAGRLAIDPTGRRLLALTATGDIRSYDTETLAETGSAAAGADPRDVAVDPQGSLVYVSRGAGDVSVLSLSSLAPLATVPVTGAPRGLVLSPAGGLGYVANRSADRLEVINLNGSSPGYLTVGATFPTAADPVDAAVSPNGLLVFAAEEGASRLSVLGVGYGPIITGITPSRGNPGDIVVVTGGFASVDTSVGIIGGLWVEFDGDSVPLVQGLEPYSSTGTQLWVRVPQGYDGGPIRVVESGPAVVGMPEIFYSNPLSFRLLGNPAHALNQAVFLGQSGGFPWGDVGVRQLVATAPTNDLLAVVDLSNMIYLVDTDPFSATYGRVLATAQLPAMPVLRAMTFTPDGRRLFVGYGTADVAMYDTDRHGGSPGALLGMVDFSPLGTIPFGLGGLTMHPSGEQLIVENAVDDGLVFVETRPTSPLYLHSIASTGPLGFALDLAIHPSGKFAYMAASTGLVHIINLDPFSSQYQTQVNVFAPITETTPRSIAFSPDGSRVYMVTRDFTAVGDHVLVAYDTTNPLSPTYVAATTLATATLPDDCMLRVSPTGDRAFCDIPSVGGFFLDITDAALIAGTWQLGVIGLNGTGDRLSLAFTADGQRMLTASRGDTGVNMVEFYQAPTVGGLTGNNQVGVAGQPLPAPVRIRLLDSASNQPLVGATGEVSVAGGGGTLGDGSTHRLLATDAEGYIEIDWTLGPAPDTDPSNPANRLLVTFYSQVTYIDGIVAVAVADPQSLPLSLAQVLPSDLSTDISITTTTQATFSRAVDRATVTPSAFQLRIQGDATPVTAVYGFADGDRRVSLIPVAPLASSTTYELVVGAGLQDTGGGPLANPGVTTFTTRAPDAPAIFAVSPPAAPVGAEIVISGQGFSAVPAENTVFFNDLPVTPVSAQVNALRAVVPLNAASGVVSVTSGNQSTGTLPFNVLVGTDSPLNEVVQTTQTGVPVRSIAITPDGATAYTVSPETDQVIPIDLGTLATLPGIPVGDNPVAIVMHPNGATAYVANFGSGTVSVIGTGSNTVVQTIVVGNEPVDIVASPAGDRLYVVSSLDQMVSVVDIEPTHATYHTVTATIITGSTTKGAAVSPDGSVLYIGTANGFIIVSLDPQSYGVTATVLTGTSTKGATVSPDGTLLVLVTTTGEVLVVDVSPNGGNAVVATILTGTSTKGATVSPDGTLLYVLLENSDDILVYSIDVTAPVAVVGQGDSLGGLQVQLTLIDTISAGNDPLVLVFDPTGSGLALVANGGTGEVTFLNASSVPFGTVEASLSVEPRTLNLESNGLFVKAVLVFSAGIFPQNVDLTSILLQGQLPPDPTLVSIVDSDQDGIQELVLKFDRAAFQALLPEGEYVPVQLTGRLAVPDQAFVANDVIRTIRPTVNRPHGGETLLAGQAVTIAWTSPASFHATSVGVHVTTDDGQTWSPVVTGVPDTGEAAWTVPAATTSERCFVMVTLYDDVGEEKCSGLTAAAFTIRETPVGVSFASVAVAADDGDGLLRWTLAAPADLDGFHVLRSGAEDGEYARLTDAPLAPAGADASGSFEFRDTGVIAGQDYFYRLEEVRAGEPGMQHGPFRLLFETRNGLDQNYPNAFNPKTTIRFSLAREMRARLTVYDVAGRRVRTLVNGVLPPDVYRVEWDGVGDHGGPVASGVYLYRLETDDFSDVKKMMLVR